MASSTFIHTVAQPSPASISRTFFMHDGKFKIDFVLWRVLVCIPLVILAYWFRELLEELRIYPEKLKRKHIWTMKELMEMTGKDEKTTETIMNHVLESCFIVDQKNVL